MRARSGAKAGREPASSADLRLPAAGAGARPAAARGREGDRTTSIGRKGGAERCVCVGGRRRRVSSHFPARALLPGRPQATSGAAAAPRAQRATTRAERRAPGSPGGGGTRDRRARARRGREQKTNRLTRVRCAPARRQRPPARPPPQKMWAAGSGGSPGEACRRPALVSLTQSDPLPPPPLPAGSMEATRPAERKPSQ